MSDFDIINNLSPFSDEFRRSLVDIGLRAGEGEVLSPGPSYAKSFNTGGVVVFLAKLLDSQQIGSKQQYRYKWEEFPNSDGRKSTAIGSQGVSDEYRFAAINAAELGNGEPPASGAEGFATYGVKVGTITSGAATVDVTMNPIVKNESNKPQPVVLMFASQRGITIPDVTEKVHYFFNAANSVEVSCSTG